MSFRKGKAIDVLHCLAALRLAEKNAPTLRPDYAPDV
jgi:hypothetical protein